ncbi:hypothetical protein RJD24_19625 [Bacillaceae bacterium IKA-2]|nr:hypothetical protein RJD24_19625 [Bacillaceae bacterium IKA-2]
MGKGRDVNEGIYRPTVRMDSIFKDYIDQVFHSTGLDRKRIIMHVYFKIKNR